MEVPVYFMQQLQISSVAFPNLDISLASKTVHQYIFCVFLSLFQVTYHQILLLFL